MKLLEEVLARDVGLQSQDWFLNTALFTVNSVCFFPLFIDSKGSFPNVTD